MEPAREKNCAAQWRGGIIHVRLIEDFGQLVLADALLVHRQINLRRALSVRFDQLHGLLDCLDQGFDDVRVLMPKVCRAVEASVRHAAADDVKEFRTVCTPGIFSSWFWYGGWEKCAVTPPPPLPAVQPSHRDGRATPSANCGAQPWPRPNCFSTAIPSTAG